MLIFNISVAVWYNIYKSLRVCVRVLIYTGAHCTHTDTAGRKSFHPKQADFHESLNLGHNIKH